MSSPGYDVGGDLVMDEDSSSRVVVLGLCRRSSSAAVGMDSWDNMFGIVDSR